MGKVREAAAAREHNRAPLTNVVELTTISLILV
jgi:hypothetical protein